MYIDENRNVVFESNDYYIRYHISHKLIDIPGATLLTFNEYLKHTTSITDADREFISWFVNEAN